MRPIDIFYKIQNQARKIIRLKQFDPSSEHGRKAIANELERQGKKAAAKIDFSDKRQRSVGESESANFADSPVNRSGSIYINDARDFYPEYNCFYNNPLACEQPLQTQKKAPQARFCSQCAFPVPLPEKQEIRGRKGTYKIESLLGNRGKGRIYRGTQVNNRASVAIKEYLLPNRSFSEAEARKQRQQSFLQISGLTTVDRVSSDSRSILPLDAIADDSRNACYLITSDLSALPTLNSYIAQHGAMKSQQAINLLDQILQTLEFLHGQKLQLPSGEIQEGLVHGNLNLDSVLATNRDKQSFYYLCDLSIWEDLFDPAISQVSTPKVIDDLVALGYIGFYVLVGKVIDPATGIAVNPRDDGQWRSLDPNLKRFVLQLLGLNSRFDNATAARNKLRYLTLEDRTQNTNSAEEAAAEKPKRWRTPIVGGSLLLLLGLGVGLIIKKPWQPERIITANGVKLTAKIEEVGKVPAGDFHYVVNKPSILVGNKLSQAIEQNQPKLKLQYSIVDSPAMAIASIEPETIDFALINSTTEGEMDEGRLTSQAVAYNGLLVVVPFDSSGGLAKHLEAKITVEQLRRLYTGKVTSWQQIAENAPNIPVKLFVPEEGSAIELFERLILQNDADIKQFRELLAADKIEQLDHQAMLQQIREDYQKQKVERVGGIAFGFISQVYKQCNGYPLSVVENDREPTSLLLRNNSANDPIDLFRRVGCKEKSSYRLNEAIFRDRSYPLSFNLNVVYPLDNQYEIGEKALEILKTKEAQCLIRNNNLIPLQSLTDSDCWQPESSS